MSAAEPRIAVVIPCHNDGELLLEAIRSIDEPEPVEIVVVDDGSTDESTHEALDLAAERGAQVIRLGANRGPAAARTAALETVHAEYVFPLDADDLAVAGALSTMADRLDSFPEAEACFGDYAEFGTHDAVRAVAERIDPYRLAYKNDFGAALFRRTVLEAVGGWDPEGYDIAGYEDWHVWMSLAERGGRGVHAGRGFVTYRRRLHGHTMLAAARSRHRMLYANLRSLHPRLFAELPAHRRRSELRAPRKALYPFIYGRRPRFFFEARLRVWLHRARLRPLDR